MAMTYSRHLASPLPSTVFRGGTTDKSCQLNYFQTLFQLDMVDLHTWLGDTMHNESCAWQNILQQQHCIVVNVVLIEWSVLLTEILHKHRHTTQLIVLTTSWSIWSELTSCWDWSSLINWWNILTRMVASSFYVVFG